MGIDYPVLIGEQEGFEAVQAFGMETVLPFTVFADRQGRIVTLKVGELHAGRGRVHPGSGPGRGQRAPGAGGCTPADLGTGSRELAAERARQSRGTAGRAATP